MSEDRSERRQRGPDPEEVWGRLVQAQQAGKPLTEEQLRALNIRKTTLSVAAAMRQLMEDPSIQRDTVKEAELTVQYWQGLLDLEDLGIKHNMHVGDTPDSFNNPRTFACTYQSMLNWINDNEETIY